MTLDNTVGEVLDNAQALAAMEQMLPGVASSPMIKLVKKKKISQVIDKIPGINEEKKAAIVEALKAIN